MQSDNIASDNKLRLAQNIAFWAKLCMREGKGISLSINRRLDKIMPSYKNKEAAI